MRTLILFAGIALSSVLFSCQNSKSTEDAKVITITTSEEPMMLCGKCGEIKGGEMCCKADVEKCASCGLHKGAAGCCKITADAALCSVCGEIKGTEKCCSADAIKCDKCGMTKGAPGCCKKKE